MRLNRGHEDFSAEWFPEEETLEHHAPLYQKYLNLYLFVGAVLLVLTVHKVDPVYHKVEVPVEVVRGIMKEVPVEVPVAAAPTQAPMVADTPKTVTVTKPAPKPLGVQLKNGIFAGIRFLHNPEIRDHNGVTEIEVGVGRAFVPGRAELARPARKEFGLMAERLASVVHGKTVTISAYSDDTPVIKNRHLYADNFVLTKARAESVAKIFRAHGVKSIETVGHGANHPRYPNRDADGNPDPENQLLNRRVVIRFQ